MFVFHLAFALQQKPDGENYIFNFSAFGIVFGKTLLNQFRLFTLLRLFADESFAVREGKVKMLLNLIEILFAVKSFVLKQRKFITFKNFKMSLSLLLCGFILRSKR